MRAVCSIILLLNCFLLPGQNVQVPKVISFAGITLHIHDDARREIQSDVDLLTKYEKYFKLKVDRARTYFPIIERIFAEEKLPEDFKYLVLQESALIADAVSKTNAVGFWQFKDFTAAEMGLEMNKDVDERMNIVSSTRAAARYLKKNNFFFNNWLFALQAYQMGAGGVMRSEKDTMSGAKEMDITSKTYWYVKKYLAHKIAFEQAIPGLPNTSITVYPSKEKKTLKDLSDQFQVAEEELRDFNKWLRRDRLPGDKTYFVVLPGEPGNASLAASSLNFSTIAAPATELNVAEVKYNKHIKINGVTAYQAEKEETSKQFAQRVGISLTTFLKCNELSSAQKLISGNYYFVGTKRSRAQQAYHHVEAGETLWAVSQQYGVKMGSIRRFNSLKKNEKLTSGMILWLSSKKPARSNAVPDHVVELDVEDAFNWSMAPVKPQNSPDTSVISEKVVAPSPQKPEKPGNIKQADSLVVVKVDTSNGLPVEVKTKDTGVAPPELPSDKPIQTIVVVPPRPRTHTVVAGETLYGIAKKYDLPLMELAKHNNIQIKDGIKPGQILNLALEQSKTEEDSPVSGAQVHIVKDSDTLYGIARKYGVTIKELMEWNDKKDFEVSIGEELKVYSPPGK